MKVLIYSHEFPPFCGGAGTYSYDLAVGLSMLGVEIHVATPRIAVKAEQGRLGVQYAGIQMHYMADWQTGETFAHGFLLLLQLRYRFDLVIVTERRAQEVFATFRREYFPYAAVIHGSEVLVYFGGKGARLPVDPGKMLKFYERAVISIAISKATLKLTQNLLVARGVNLVAVQNGVNLDRLSPADARNTQALLLRYGLDTKIVFSLGRLDLDKGQDILIAAFSKIHRVYPEALLLIGGDGPYMKDLMALRDSLALGESVHFLGEIPQSDLPAFFDLCDVFALTSKSESRWEGFGLVYLEAGFYEKAVVGGSEGGVPEAISDNESGLVVNPRDENEVASAIAFLLSDKTLRERMGAYGRKRVLEYFNSERMAAETLGYIRQALSDSSQRRFSSPGFGLICWTLTELPSVCARWLVHKLRGGIGRDW